MAPRRHTADLQSWPSNFRGIPLGVGRKYILRACYESLDITLEVVVGTAFLAG